MTAELRRSLLLAGAGLLAGFALVVALFGGGDLVRRGFGSGPAPLAGLPTTAPEKDASSDRTSPTVARPSSDGNPRAGRMEEGGAGQPGKSGPVGIQVPATASPAVEALAPTFDIIRVEPDGESVIAGRGAPNTTVELLRDGAPIARALIDPSGQFALVPPALPPGGSEITLRITGADGQVRRSKESVAVVVSDKRDTKPLIAMSAPDRPTVVLSQPEPARGDMREAHAKPAAEGVGTGKGKETGNGTGKGAGGGTGKGAGKSVDTGSGKPGQAAPAPANAAAGPSPVKVVSVDAEEGGRLFVTGQAPSGTTVRLYLNDTLVAPGSAGPDGRVAFAIGRGIAPGDYRVRLDEVDSVTGKVKTRSEVAFSVPVPVARAEPAAKPRDRERLAASAAPAAPATAMPPVRTPSAPTPQAMAVKEQPAADHTMPRRSEARPSEARSGGITPPPAVPREAALPAALQDMAGGTVFIPEIGTAKIARGDSLWQISRRIYGKGTRYTVIFDANQSQIRNPDLIYPGQIFVLPTDGTAAVRQEGKRG